MSIKLQAKARTLTGKKVSVLRLKNEIPAVLYGHGTENRNLSVDASEFKKVFAAAGFSTIIDLAVDGQENLKAILADTQNDPISDAVTHIDLKMIRMDEKITAEVEIKFTGEAPAVKELDGVLVHNINHLEIKCLPGDLLHEIAVDLSVLKTFDDYIKIASLNLPKNIEIVGHEPEDVVATVTMRRIEKEPEPVVAEAITPEGEAAKQGEEKKAGEAVKPGEEKKGEKKEDKK